MVAAIYGGNGKKVQGLAGNFSSPDGKNVVVNFTENKSETPQEVHYEKIQWPNHKVEKIAQTKRATAITNWKTNGANNAQEALLADEVAQFVPAD